MTEKKQSVKLLLVDDEVDFRSAARKVMEQRGFVVAEAGSGEEALRSVRGERPDAIVLDLKMPGMGGIETLWRIREIAPAVPVIILTGHGRFNDALAGIQLDIVDFLQKPVDLPHLAARIHDLLRRKAEPVLSEKTLEEIMVPPALYPKLHVDQPVEEALEALREVFFRPHDPESLEAQRIRSVLIFDRTERFVAILRFSDLMKLVLPPFLGKSPYSTYFTGMFLAQCKVIGKRRIDEILGEDVRIDLRSPLMEGVHLMVKHRLINLPVMDGSRLAGILREKDIVLEIMRNLGSLV